MNADLTGPSLTADIRDYWDEAYANTRSATLPDLPSQFGVFVAAELAPGTLVLDIGCGNGRDSRLFAERRHPLIGVDVSRAAIERCESAMGQPGSPSASFLCADIADPQVLDAVVSRPEFESAPAVLIYSRFFLHAVPESYEDTLLGLTKQLSAKRPVRLAVEFRTIRDSSLPKEIRSLHYRRYIHPPDVIRKASLHGLGVEYFVEGFGFAKFGVEDAYVARCIFFS